MPHQCTTCGQTFPDGSKEMLSGCPGCGGNKFQYLPSDVLGEDREPITEPSSDTPPDPDDGVTETVGRAATTVRDYVSRRRSDDDPTARRTESETTSQPSAADQASTTTAESTDEIPDETESSSPTPTPHEEDVDEDAESLPAEADEEDQAQAAARGDIVDRTSLPDESVAAGTSPPGEGRVIKEPDVEDDVDRPGLEELREELNEQFESIRIVAPGQYELNLMELYDREEHIIALQEDGRYVIQVPESWREADDE